MWIKLHRSIEEWGWWTEPFTAHLFMQLLLEANWKPGSWRGIEIPVGGLVTSRKKLAEKTGLSEKQVRTALDRLKKTGEITCQPVWKATLIVVTNYARFQQLGNYASEITQNSHPEGPAKGPAKGQQRASKRPSENSFNQSGNDEFSQCEIPGNFEETSKKGQQKGHTRRLITDKDIKDVKTLPPNPPQGGQAERSGGGSVLSGFAERYSDPEVLNAWAGYIEMRQQAGRPLVLRSIGPLMDSLDELTALNSERVRLIDLATANGWLNIYPPRAKKSSQEGPNLPDWYKTVPDEPASAEDLERARAMRKEIIGDLKA